MKGWRRRNFGWWCGRRVRGCGALMIFFRRWRSCRGVVDLDREGGSGDSGVVGSRGKRMG